MTFVRKAVQAVALFIVGMVLQTYHFAGKGATTQPPEAIHGIALVFGIGAVIFLTVGLLSARRFRLNQHNHALLIAEIQHRRAGGAAADASVQTRQVAETLTGWPWASLWGNNDIMRRIDPRAADLNQEGTTRHDPNSI